MRNERLSVEDRAHLLVNEHYDWVRLQAKQLDREFSGHETMDFEDIADTVTYGYLESVASPLKTVDLFADELDPETRFYTPEFAGGVYVAIEKAIGGIHE